MKILKLEIKGTGTVGSCIQVQTKSITDTIEKNKTYNNVVVKSINIKNNCDQTFLLPAKTLFKQQDNFGSTFTASVEAKTIAPFAEITIPIYYNGIYKNNSTTAEYVTNYNNINIIYTLTITVPNTPGTISDITRTLENRQDLVLKTSFFTPYYSDIDGNTIQSVSFSGDVSNLRYKGVGYQVGTEIPFSELNTGVLIFKAPLQDASSTVNFTYTVKDNLGNIIV